MSIATDPVHAGPGRTGGAFERRPWGSWEVLGEGPGYKVKRIVVSPRSRLSLQTHAQRAERWTVVSGEARCTVGRRRHVLRAGDTLEVPVGAAHRLANAADVELVVVEVQLGDYTGEDDIVRLQDDYGR